MGQEANKIWDWKRGPVLYTFFFIESCLLIVFEEYIREENMYFFKENPLLQSLYYLTIDCYYK